MSQFLFRVGVVNVGINSIFIDKSGYLTGDIGFNSLLCPERRKQVINYMDTDHMYYVLSQEDFLKKQIGIDFQIVEVKAI